MTATLRFTLPEEQEELTAALQAQAVRGVLSELDNWLRGELKYADPPEARAAALQEARDKLRVLLEEAGVRLWA
jgi:hypothetical protein